MCLPCRLSPFLANTYATNFNVDLFYKDFSDPHVEEHRSQLQLYGDNELLAIVAEQDRDVNEDEDWAFPGSQTGNR